MNVPNSVIQEIFEDYINNRQNLMIAKGTIEPFFQGRVKEAEIMFHLLGIDYSYERIKDMIEGKKEIRAFDVEPEEPWYVEEWYDEDLAAALEANDIGRTDKNIRKAREICKGIFDDLSDRNEKLIQVIGDADEEWEGAYTLNSFIPTEEVARDRGAFAPWEDGFPFSINSSLILSFLIQVAGKICKQESSDLFPIWQNLIEDSKRPDYEGGRYLFGFRENGIDFTEQVLYQFNNGNQDRIKELYLLEVKVDKASVFYGTLHHMNAITIILSKAKEV